MEKSTDKQVLEKLKVIELNQEIIKQNIYELLDKVDDISMKLDERGEYYE